ncbi:hypothetical protein ACFFOS_02535 [Nocardioides kongjuensis]|uniref:Uncharacterized protein n=1 Tax=Nocardioides kongjuensis TaxID=349522 RepID=A0A852RPS7_9ACTN|nr:hypothetical protein [Nocardioides kongjuensis]NYD28652.1 hypothetical protein [Nocardioides kongjuensis]
MFEHKSASSSARRHEVAGALASWGMALGESGNLISGLGMLLLATPLLALLTAAVNFWLIDLALTPVRAIVTRPRS